MARERRDTAEESAAVPGQRAEPPPDAGREDADRADARGADEGRADADRADEGRADEGREGTGPQARPAVPPAHRLRRTRLSGMWAAVVGFGIVLLLLLIFILQNQNTVEVSYFGAHGRLALGVALLLSAVAGILLVALAGSARIMQLRATARKHRRAEKKAAKS
jgi:uncharacterized integral membrane protein